MHFSATAWREECTRRLPAERLWLRRQGRQPVRAQAGVLSLHHWVPLGIVTAMVFEVKTDVLSAGGQCVRGLVCRRYTIGRARYRYRATEVSAYRKGPEANWLPGCFL